MIPSEGAAVFILSGTNTGPGGGSAGGRAGGEGAGSEGALESFRAVSLMCLQGFTREGQVQLQVPSAERETW